MFFKDMRLQNDLNKNLHFENKWKVKLRWNYAVIDWYEFKIISFKRTNTHDIAIKILLFPPWQKKSVNHNNLFYFVTVFIRLPNQIIVMWIPIIDQQSIN